MQNTGFHIENECEITTSIHITMKVCKICNETDQTKFSTRWRGLLCVECFNKRQKEKGKQGQDRNIISKLQRKECLVCKLKVTETTTHHFEWDHIDHTQKEHCVGHLRNRTDELFYAEIAKCDLLCLFCHRDKTIEQVKNKIFGKAGRPRI